MKKFLMVMNIVKNDKHCKTKKQLKQFTEFLILSLIKYEN